MAPVLGISAYYHDSAAAVVLNGRPLAAAQEERFTRIRHDSAFPANAVRHCLTSQGLRLDDLDAVAYYEDPRLKLRRILASHVAAAPFALDTFVENMSRWLPGRFRIEDELRNSLDGLGLGRTGDISIRRHHESHAASAFLPSPFPSAAVLCVDGVGEWDTTTIWHGIGEELRGVRGLAFPHSLGLLYSAFTYFCGFKVDSGEYKLMGLAPYGRPRYEDVIRQELIDIKDDGSFRLDMRYFEYLRGRVMTGRGFERLFGQRRTAEAELTEHHFDLAASVQAVTADVMVRLSRTARDLTSERTLCLAGGVALNCVANGVISRAEVFDDIWVQPAAGDAGGALGAALIEEHDRRPSEPLRSHCAAGQDAMGGSLLGPEYGDEAVHEDLDDLDAVYSCLPVDDLLSEVAGYLAGGLVVAWFQGPMEFGPRALGARSILGDPRRQDMQSTMNLKIKFRESFRPFAPSVLSDRATEYFDLSGASPYMLLVASVAPAHRLPSDERDEHAVGLDRLRVPRSTVPAVTHVDGSARVQTVDGEGHQHRYHALLRRFDELTGCPVLINTSFNVRGEPIVNTPREAYTCFMRTGIDVLVIGNAVLEKEKQPVWDEHGRDWRAEIALD